MDPRYVNYQPGSTKLWRGLSDGQITHYGFHCFGCGTYHCFQVKPVLESDPIWSFNGDENNPTFSPSLVVETPEMRCHLMVRNGKITYLSDCTHSLAGWIVALRAEPPESADS